MCGSEIEVSPGIARPLTAQDLYSPGLGGHHNSLLPLCSLQTATSSRSLVGAGWSMVQIPTRAVGVEPTQPGRQPGRRFQNIQQNCTKFEAVGQKMQSPASVSCNKSARVQEDASLGD